MTHSKNRGRKIEARFIRARLGVVMAAVAAFLGLLIFGCSTGSEKRTEGSVGVQAEALTGADAVPCNAWSSAVVANSGKVTLNPQSTVDSYRSTAGAYGGSNVGNLAIVQAATTITNNGLVKGQLLPSSPSNLAVVPVPSGAIKLPLGASTPGSLNINTAGSSITLAPGNYVAANISVNFPGAINVAPAGQVRIWVTGTLNLGGNENLNGVPRNLAFLVTSTSDVNVNATGSLFGLVYAPTSKVNVNSKVFGGVVGSIVTLNSQGAVHTDVSSTTRELSCSGHGSCGATPSTCTCDLGWTGSTCGTSSGPAVTPRPLPKPPSQIGCYWYTLNGWEAIPCEPVSDVIAAVGKPAIPPALSSPYVEGTPNPTTSRNKPLIAPPGSTALPYTFAQAEMLIPTINDVKDAVPTPADTFPGCKQTGSPIPNALSVQLNTNKFVMANGDNGAIQFAFQSSGLNNDMHMCAWQVDATTQDYDQTTVCVKGPAPRRGTPLQPFDFVNIAGSVDAAAGTLSIVVQLSWVQPGFPNIYAQTGPDRFGLAGHWFSSDAAILGMGGCTQAQFTDTTVVTRMMGSTCPGVSSANSSFSACPAALKLEPNAKFENRTATAETNNLIQLGTSAVSYPNPFLAVTNVTQTTTGACIDPKHVYVRDYPLDSGGVPSNAGGQAFWESPDIFLVPKDSPVDAESTPAQSLITPGTDYDVWVRVHNDLGCAPVNGAKALVYIADPSALSTPWAPLTNNEYQAATAAGNTVPAGGKSLIGPFHYHAPTTGFGDGHKCLIAAITATGEAPVSNFFDAPNSNQVAQRNVQLENCAFPLTNATGSSGDAEITISVTPPETVPSLNTLPNMSVSFDDDNSAWYNVWVAQPENGKAYSVTRIGNKTSVRLGKASVTLRGVPLPNGESRTARGTFDLASGAPDLKLDLRVTLKNPSNGAVLAPQNGGSCMAYGGPVVQ
ncbi:MAG: calcium-binding EGF-like domain-containing protein [Myxococcales bacterium]